jgi:hypothetical protein
MQKEDKMAMLLRVGIDKSSDGVLSPIHPDGSFEYIPLSEKDDKSKETRTYHDLRGNDGKLLSSYLPQKVASRRVHLDPEFTTFTYGDEGKKANYLRKLKPGDLLVFYAGLTPSDGKYPEALYIIGYFTITEIIDIAKNRLSADRIFKEYRNNSHPKRFDVSGMVLVVGDTDKSELLEKAILISEKKLNKIGRTYHAVSPQMEELLGIKGSIQRSIPPRFINEENKLKNLQKILKLL